IPIFLSGHCGSPLVWLALDREQRDALDAVLGGRALGALGDEAVLVVLLETVELEAGGLDRLAIVVALVLVTMSASASRPPGRRTRAASANTGALSGGGWM